MSTSGDRLISAAKEMREALKWTPERDAYLREFYLFASPAFLASLLGVTRNAVIGRAFRLGLKSNHPRGRKVDPAMAVIMRSAGLKHREIASYFGSTDPKASMRAIKRAAIRGEHP